MYIIIYTIKILFVGVDYTFNYFMDHNSENYFQGKKGRTSKGQRKVNFCSYCNYSTDHLSHMKLHLRIHTGERPFKCANCDKTFTRKHHLQTHLLVHQSNQE